jgi:hypothetical protein
VAVVVVHQGPTLTEASYNAAVLKVTGGKAKLDSPADWPVDGLVFHTAGQGASGFRIVDVWESEEAFQRFGETLGPVLGELGITEQPEVYEASTFVSR